MSGSKRNAMKKTAILVSAVALSACLFGCSQAEQPHQEHGQTETSTQEQTNPAGEAFEYINSDLVDNFVDGFDLLINTAPTDPSASFDEYVEATDGFYNDCVALITADTEDIPESCRGIHDEFVQAANKAGQADSALRAAAYSSGADRDASFLDAQYLLIEASEHLLDAMDEYDAVSGEQAS